MSAGTPARPPEEAPAGADPAAPAAGGADGATTASLGEQLRAIERDLRELVRLHGELARFEARAGLLRLVIGMFMLGVGMLVGGLVLLSAGFALYLFLVRFMPPAGAASLVAVAFAIASLGTWFVAWRLLQGAGSLFLPRTRAILQEMFTWPKKPTGS